MATTKIPFLGLGKNLLNPATMLTDKGIQQATIGFEIYTVANYSVSDFIPVKVGTTYAVTKIRKYGIYNNAKNTLTVTDVPSNTPQLITPSIDGYIRLMISTSAVANAQFEVGNTQTEFEPYGYRISNTVLIKKDNFDKTLKEEYESSVLNINNLTTNYIKSMYALKSGTSYKIKYRRNNTENEVFEFNELGINKLIHPKKIYRETASDLTNDFVSPLLWYTINTDWISPYEGITALTGTTTSFTGTVGGNHGTIGDAGFATARNISATMYADGKEVTEGQVVNCDKVILVVKNYISASNKINTTTGEKADSLEETVTYIITPNNIEVSVYLTALEDLTINGYTGLQMTTDMFTGQVYYNDSANKYSVDGVMHYSSLPPFDGDRMIYADANNVIATYLNLNVGLGERSHLSTISPFYLSTFGKLYAHLIQNNQPLTLLTGESQVYSGGYTFCVPLVCVGAEKAYFIKLNNELIYCVDFLNPATNAYLLMDIECLGKEIEIVEKSNSITCDTIVSGKGLKMSASDWGTLKFKVTY